MANNLNVMFIHIFMHRPQRNQCFSVNNFGPSDIKTCKTNNNKLYTIPQIRDVLQSVNVSDIVSLTNHAVLKRHTKHISYAGPHTLSVLEPGARLMGKMQMIYFIILPQHGRIIERPRLHTRTPSFPQRILDNNTCKLTLEKRRVFISAQFRQLRRQIKRPSGTAVFIAWMSCACLQYVSDDDDRAALRHFTHTYFVVEDIFPSLIKYSPFSVDTFQHSIFRYYNPVQKCLNCFHKLYT